MSAYVCLSENETHPALRAIDNVEAVLSTIVKDIEDVTGLKAHFMVGGPEPKRNGKMVFFTFVCFVVVIAVAFLAFC